MPEYGVYAFCNECGDVHPMGIRIALKNGPDEKQSLGDTYSGKELPQKIATLISNYINCPKTGKMFIQTDNNQIFLVPV